MELGPLAKFVVFFSVAIGTLLLSGSPFTSRQGVLRSKCHRTSPAPSGLIGRNKGPSLSSPMPARSRYARTGRAASSRILRRFLFRFSVTWRIMLDPVGLKMPHAGLNDRRDPAAGDEEDLHRTRSRIPCKVSIGIASKSEMACRWVNDGVEFSCTPGALTAPMSCAVSQGTSPLAASWW